MVHAYDLNMQVPDTPIPPEDDDSMDVISTITKNGRKPTLPEGGKSVFFRRSKRQRTSDSQESTTAPASKHHRHLQSPRLSAADRNVSPHTASLKVAVEERDDITGGMEGIVSQPGNSPHMSSATIEPQAAYDYSESESVATPGLRHTKVRELLRLIINESLKVGGRPDSAIAEDTDGGEVIEVRTRNPDGESRIKVIEWFVDPQIPETILVDERDLAKLVSCVFVNAVKFTEEGKITLRASLTFKAKFVVITVTDTGPGIPEAFQPYLFKPFSREDDSLTRQKEGLGLGLLVAKGLARRIGGDLICVRTAVSGPTRGSEFEIRVPLSTAESNSRAETPTRTPTPSHPSEPKSKQTRQKASVSSTRATTQTPDPGPLAATSLSQTNPIPSATPTRRPSAKQAPTFDRNLAQKHPLTFLVAEDNKINRKLLVNMLGKLGYAGVHEAYDGVEAVHQMSIDREARGEKPVDVILMDLWMPNMDGYEATQRIFAHEKAKADKEKLPRDHERAKGGGATSANRSREEAEDEEEEDDDDGSSDLARRKVTVLAVSADVTDRALERASEVGMEGFMPKPYKLLDLERLILEHCVGQGAFVQM